MWDIDAFPPKSSLSTAPVPNLKDVKKHGVAKLQLAYKIFVAPESQTFEAPDVPKQLTGLGYSDPKPSTYTTLKDRLRVLANFCASHRMDTGAFQATGGLSSEQSNSLGTLESMADSIEEYLEASKNDKSDQVRPCCWCWLYCVNAVDARRKLLKLQPILNVELD